ncbi:MAG: 50S ribosomal protein L11 methyltransferase [Burkholderiales bacterium]
MTRAARSSAQRPAWLRAEFVTKASLADDAAGVLVANGALGCAVKPALRRPHLPRATVRLEAFFDGLPRRRLRRVTETLRRSGMIAPGSSAPTIERIHDPGWATMWMSKFAPLEIGRRLLIVPPWQQVERRGRISIVIKPAQAFGTGRHATTVGVLRAVERACTRAKIRRALDAGTGSGIIAIAMARLGAESVVAVDTDRLAVANARENAALNRASARIGLARGSVSAVRGRFDLIAANIFSATLIALAPQLIRRLRANGTLVLGGILAREAPAVRARYARRLRCVSVGVDRRWATLVFRK